MATAARDTEPTETVVVHAPHEWDVSRPEIYAEDRWQPIFREMRAKAPINKVIGSDYADYWNVTSYKAIQQVESLPDIYSSSGELGGITIVNEDNDLPEEIKIKAPMFIAMDRPEHTAQRRVIAPAFTPGEMERMSTDIRRRTAELLDSLPFDEEFDWVDTVSIELTTQMLAILFDFPWEDRRKLTEWSDWAGDITASLDEARAREQLAKLFEMAAYFKNLWDQRLDADEAPDLLSRMIHSEMREMDEMTFLGNLMLLVVGGNDTTRNSMSGFAYGLDQFPGEREKLEKNPELIPGAVQELLRWQTPLAHMRRTTTQDTELMGHRIPEGEKVILWYISANRDEEMFERPDDIILDREKPGRHLAFGWGIHRCVGARLAELQLRLLLEEMAARRIRVNVTGDPVRVAQCFVHGFRKLPVTLSKY
ncbi:MAG: cytochrome P450 [Parasphingopyxis sp.]|nr:cytochrome P450 [Sphingomonadales bacterium]